MIAESNGKTTIKRDDLAAAKAVKVAIVGTWPKTLAEVPCDDKSWDIWTCSNAPQRLTRCTRHFELHEIESHEDKWKRDGIWAMLQAVPQLYLTHPHVDFPAAIIYPRETILKTFGSRYFTSSIAWMLALAIYEEVDEIGLYGVNMETRDEYENQRACCEYLLGVAVGRGINVHIPAACTLLKSPRLYGYETNRGPAFEQLEQREQELQAKLKETQEKLNTATQDINLIRGALMETQYLRRVI